MRLHCVEAALALANNRLTGTIPTEIGRLPLVGIWLSANELTGSIPTEMLALSDLNICELVMVGDNNTFSGGRAPSICSGV